MLKTGHSILKLIITTHLLMAGSISYGQNAAPASDPPSSTPAPGESEAPYTDDGWTDPVIYPEAERRATCRKYEGKLISYYDSVYKVEKCQFREIQDSTTILKMNRSGAKILSVEGDVLAKLDRGQPIANPTGKADQQRSCKQLNRQYATFNYLQIFWIENCQRRLFPDWETLTTHRKKTGMTHIPIVAITFDELSQLRPGSDFVSDVDQNTQKQQTIAKEVDVIPQDEACKGINGKDVSYVDKIYRIENCKKREYDSEKFWKKRFKTQLKLKEISSSQWISLPEGRPMDLSKD